MMVSVLEVDGGLVAVPVLLVRAMVKVARLLKVILKGCIRRLWIFIGTFCKPKVTSSLKDKFRKNS